MNLVLLFLSFTAVSAYYYEDYELPNFNADFEDDNWIPVDFDFFPGYKPDRSADVNMIRKSGDFLNVIVDPETGATYAPVEFPQEEISEFSEEHSEFSTSEKADNEVFHDPQNVIVSPETGDSYEPVEVTEDETYPESSEEPAAISNPEDSDPEVFHEPHYESLLVGSIRGIPGIHFPDYIDIPLTSFSCYDKMYMPGFYADLETGCQVFHVCWPHRRESFLCPIGTIFNQAILTCDYWYSSNCSMSPYYYNVNAASAITGVDESSQKTHIGSMIDTLIERPSSAAHPTPDSPETSLPQPTKSDLSYIMKFLPVKAKVRIYTEGKSEGKISVVAEASVGAKRGKKKPVTTECAGKPAVTETSVYPKQASSTREPLITEKPVYPETTWSSKPVVTERPMYPKTTRKPVKTEQPTYPKSTSTQVPTKEPVYPKTTPSTTLKPVMTEQPVYPKQTPSTQKPVVTKTPVYPKQTPSTQKPVVTKTPVYPKTTAKEVVTERPVYPKRIPAPETVVTRKPLHPMKPGHIIKEKPTEHKVKMHWNKAHGGIDPSVSKIIDNVFNIAKKIAKEGGDFVPKAKWLKERRIPAVPKKVPLTKLNPKFIVKPFSVEQPVTAAPVHKLVTERKLKKQKVPKKVENSVKVEDLIGFKPVFLPLNKLNMQLQVSPLTKKALTENYIKLWQEKIKKF